VRYNPEFVNVVNILVVNHLVQLHLFEVAFDFSLDLQSIIKVETYLSVLDHMQEDMQHPELSR